MLLSFLDQAGPDARPTKARSRLMGDYRECVEELNSQSVGEEWPLGSTAEKRLGEGFERVLPSGHAAREVPRNMRLF